MREKKINISRENLLTQGVLFPILGRLKVNTNTFEVGRDGGIGRRARLKISFHYWSEGSIPSLGTIIKNSNF